MIWYGCYIVAFGLGFYIMLHDDINEHSENKDDSVNRPIRNDIKKYIIASNDFTTEGDLDPVVRIVELGGSSIDLLIVAYADPMGFAEFSEVKENLIFNIMRIVKEHKSEFAYPSTSLYVESMPK